VCTSADVTASKQAVCDPPVTAPFSLHIPRLLRRVRLAHHSRRHAPSLPDNTRVTVQTRAQWRPGASRSRTRTTRPISPGRRHVREGGRERHRPCGPRTRSSPAPVAPVAGRTRLSRASRATIFWGELAWRVKRLRAHPARRRGLPAPARRAADGRQRGRPQALDAPFGDNGRDGADRVSASALPRTHFLPLVFPPLAFSHFPLPLRASVMPNAILGLSHRTLREYITLSIRPSAVLSFTVVIPFWGLLSRRG
jgi:hypothetical protein